MKKMTKLLLVTLFTICMLVLSAYASDVVMTVNGTDFTMNGGVIEENYAVSGGGN